MSKQIPPNMRPSTVELPSVASQMRKLGLLLLLVVVVTVVAIIITPKLRNSSLLANGTTAPSFTLTADDGSTRTLPSSSTGPTVVLFLEATCPHCQEEAPKVCDLARQHTQTHFVGVGAAEENADALRSFRSAHMSQCAPAVFPLLVDPTADATHGYRVAAVPTVYVIDAAGKVAYTGTGVDGVDAATAVIDRLEHG